MVAESRMRGHFKLLIFLAFLSSDPIPHPPLAWSPLSQNRRGISVNWFHWWKYTDWRKQINTDSLPSPSGRRWPNRPDEGLLQTAHFPHIFSSKHSLTHHWRGPPSPNWARVFRYRSDSTPTNMTRVFRFFPKQRCLQLGSNFSASQSALSSPTVNFPDAEILF